MILNFKILKEHSQNLSLLYVEDDSFIREKTAKIFKNLFQEVIIAKDGEEALALYEAYHKENKSYFDIIVTDMKMPNMNGIEFSKAVFQQNKEQRIIVISAYSEQEHLIEFINIGIQGFLQKPLSSENLLQVLYDACTALTLKEKSIQLTEKCSFIYESRSLLCDGVEIDLSENERKVLELFVIHKNRYFTAIDIFNHLYFEYPEKEFSNDAIKSLIKRLRKKITKEFITNSPQLGYRSNF